ncbi:AAA family ATPase [Rhodococcoides kroppenstedtii]|uniref:AAA family ATPase n=1 Tax=Rhodococcoides kroppenstedtii TaxID=293050 RepID=UPI003635545D
MSYICCIDDQIGRSVELSQAIEQGLANRSPELTKKQHSEHQEFLERFPIAGWPNMTLDHYALGTDRRRESYSYWLEWGTADLGSISGGSAKKHVIFRRPNGEWAFPAEFSDEVSTWQKLREGFVELLAAAQDGDWAKIEQIDVLRGARTVRMKTLFLYFPDQILPVFSRSALAHFSEQLGLDVSGDVLTMNRRLLEHLRLQPGLEDRPVNDLSALLYNWRRPSKEQQTTYWKIAPGELARLWPECLEGGYICVGWDEVGDLSLFDTEDDFQAAFGQTFSELYRDHQPTMRRKANELWKLLQISPGDRIIANKGTSEVLAIGEVQEPGYTWAPERAEYQHTLPVKWDAEPARKLDTPIGQWGTTTILKATRKVLDQILQTANSGTVVEAPSPSDNVFESADVALFTRWSKILDRKGQIIFFGPPGTGKTHTAKNFARWLLKDQSGDENVLKQKASKTRAWWVTANDKNDTYAFHWDRLFETERINYSYGRVKSHYEEVQIGDIVVCYQASPAQKVVGLARVASLGVGEFPLGLEPISKIENGATWRELNESDVFRQSEPGRHRSQGTLFALTDEEFSQILELSGAQIYETLRPMDDEAWLTEVTFHASYAYEEFVEGYRPIRSGSSTNLELKPGLFTRVAACAHENPNDQYILLIDEINRANLPRVFGELMTVIEKSRREERVELPASGTYLSVPDNLAILGTMNTADRSIRTLDAALRRRFGFIELMPDTSILRGTVIGELSLDIFLDELNRRLVEGAGRERQIGQSFFLDDGEPIATPEEFGDVMRTEVIPLLQEIAMDNYGQLEMYLGSTVVDADSQTFRELVNDDEKLLSALTVNFNARADSRGA